MPTNIFAFPKLKYAQGLSPAHHLPAFIYNSCSVHGVRIVTGTQTGSQNLTAYSSCIRSYSKERSWQATSICLESYLLIWSYTCDPAEGISVDGFADFCWLWVSSALLWWHACLCTRHREESQPTARGRGCSLLLAWYPGGLFWHTQARLRPQNKDTEQVENDLWRANKMTGQDAKHAFWQEAEGAGLLELLKKMLRGVAAIF